jgi:anti-repressor protein
MNEIQVFNNKKFGNVRVIEQDGEPYFVGKDIAEILGYQNSSKALNDHVDNEDKLNNESLSSLGQRGGWIINESGLYSLILGSKLPSAKEFKRWVTKDVLPTIRKTGGYVGNEDMFIDTYLPYADENVKQLFKLNLITIRQLNNKIEYMEPLAAFAETVSDTSDLIDMGRMAKLLNDEHIPIGRNKLFEWLRAKKILMSNNTPYQQYIDSGHFKVKEKVTETAYGTKIFVTTYITGKGQIYITEKLRKEYKDRTN